MKRTDETRHLFHLQNDQTPVKGLPTEEKEAIHAIAEHPAEDEGKRTLHSHPNCIGPNGGC